MAHDDYYDVLGIDPDASKDEVRQAYRRLALKHHPDHNPDDPDAEARFKRIKDAYEVLSDPLKRWQYNRFGTGPASAEDNPQGARSFWNSPRWPKRFGWAVLGCVLMALMAAGGYFAALAGLPQDDRPAPQYEAVVLTADSLYAAADYAAAQKQYLRALEMTSEPQSNTRRLSVRYWEATKRTTAAGYGQSRKAVQRGDSLLRYADSLLSRHVVQKGGDFTTTAKLFTRANQAYMEALRHSPGDSVLVAKGQQAAEGAQLALIMDAAPVDGAEHDALREQLYTLHTQQGDLLLQTGNYEAAQLHLEEALGYRPDDPYAQKQLRALDARRAEAQRQYDRHRERGDAFFEEGRYAQAHQEYKQALSAQPDNPFARQRVEQADSLATAAERREERQYQQHRAQGDALFDAMQFGAALESYKKALGVRPNDAYARHRAMEAAQEKRWARLEKRRTADGAYVAPSDPPAVVGGMTTLQREVQPPACAADAEGSVVVQMTVTAEGQVRNPRVLHGIGGRCDQEALRVVRQARFEPATVDGQPVPALHSVWIPFGNG